MSNLYPWVIASPSKRDKYKWHYTQELDLADLEEAMKKENCKVVFLPFMVDPVWTDTENNWGDLEMVLKREK